MATVPKQQLISPEDYLQGELVSEQKHEYLDGTIYLMAGANNAHNLIASNIQGTCYSQLRGRPCSAFNSDTKVRIRDRGRTRFYYPDAMIVCESNPFDDSFQDHPTVIIEVLSDSTRRIDEGEKQDAYLSIPSLAAYLLVEQSQPRVIVRRRVEDEFFPEVYSGLEEVITLTIQSGVEIDLPLAELYEGLEFTDRDN